MDLLLTAASWLFLGMAWGVIIQHYVINTFQFAWLFSLLGLVFSIILIICTLLRSRKIDKELKQLMEQSDMYIKKSREYNDC